MSRYWKAQDHQFGTGKTHEIDDRRDGRLMCGRQIKFTPGCELGSARVTCMGCRQAFENRQRNDEWKAQRSEDELRREQEREEWWAWYNSYLESPRWINLRKKVFERCRGVCEGCARSKATQVHHLTYDHVGKEMLFELVGICDQCHELLHGNATEILNRLFDSVFNKALYVAQQRVEAKQ